MCFPVRFKFSCLILVFSPRQKMFGVVSLTSVKFAGIPEKMTRAKSVPLSTTASSLSEA